MYMYTGVCDREGQRQRDKDRDREIVEVECCLWSSWEGIGFPKAWVTGDSEVSGDGAKIQTASLFLATEWTMSLAPIFFMSSMLLLDQSLI